MQISVLTCELHAHLQGKLYIAVNSLLLLVSNQSPSIYIYLTRKRCSLVCNLLESHWSEIIIPYVYELLIVYFTSELNHFCKADASG